MYLPGCISLLVFFKLHHLFIHYILFIHGRYKHRLKLVLSGFLVLYVPVRDLCAHYELWCEVYE